MRGHRKMVLNQQTNKFKGDDKNKRAGVRMGRCMNGTERVSIQHKEVNDGQ